LRSGLKKNTKAAKSKKKGSGALERSFFVSCFDRCSAFFKTRLFFESSGIILISFSVFLSIALATFHIDKGSPASRCGNAGARIAQFLITGTGLLSISFPVTLAVIGMIFFRYRQIEHKLLRLTGFVVFLFAGTALLSHLLPASSFWKDLPHASGGRLGDLLVAPLNRSFDSVGTTLLLATFVLIAITFLTGISYYRVLSRSYHRILHGIRSFLNALKRRISIWANHRRLARQQMHERDIPHPGVTPGTSGAPVDRKRTGSEPRQEPADPRITPVDMSSDIYGDATPVQVVDTYNTQSDGMALEDSGKVSGSVFMDSSDMSYTRTLEYELPDVMILDDQPAFAEKESHADLVQKSEKLVAKLKEFSIDGRITEVCPGPIITRYEFEPAPGIKISKISGLSDDLALGMRSRFGLRIAPIPGKSTLGIEIPNLHRELVNLKEILLSDEFQRAKKNSILSLPLGRDTAGRPYISDLKRMPHLLIAGATGSGKSVCINTLLAGLLFVARPSELRLLLIDPKMLELSDFNGIPHLREPVITDAKLTPDALNWAVSEMERRYRLLASFRVRNIDQFNARVTDPHYDGDQEPLPYLVIVIDELADLMLTAAATIEDAIQRLAQMARAAGIHLIIATQRPSVDVITGVIKANLPCRLAFQVASKVDSRTILDTIGAEKLIGVGDCIFVPPGTSQLLRLHGAFVSESEIKRLVEHLKQQPPCNKDEDSIFVSVHAPDGELDAIDDPMYDDAVRLVLRSGVASISMLQRRLKIGHSRASRLIDFMELSGIVGPHIGSKTREILVEPDEYLERLDDIKETGIYE
jgi:DNA segregation ATPase FtsK/SpoIIIE, S-DNA-T family